MQDEVRESLGAPFGYAAPAVQALVGSWPTAPSPAMANACALVFSGMGNSPNALHAYPDAEEAFAAATVGFHLALIVSRRSMHRLGGAALTAAAASYHLPTPLRATAMAIIDTRFTGETRETYRLGKSLEVLCDTIQLHAAGELLPLAAAGRKLSAADTRRVLAARRLIDEHCGEKLTLSSIARSCGLNRSKLTRGFRDVFGCTVAEALTACRLERASAMLLTTDLPVASIGHETGYENNASFARAFGRRYGRTPTDFRMRSPAA